jgi:DNA-binding transcriptional LysR family regulator
MDNRAGEMQVFVLSAELKSFSAAGRKLAMSPSAVSKLVSRIEDRLGVRLLLRSTRTLALTPEGELYLSRARAILKEIDATEELISGDGQVPHGILRVNASVGFGENCVLPLVGEFLALYPKIELELTLTDGVVDLVGERTDVAIRVGPMKDSTLKARKLMQGTRAIVASPAYIARHGVPETPDDLDRHNCLDFTFRRHQDGWPFRNPQTGTQFLKPIKGNLRVSNGAIMRQLCLDGIGIARIGRFHVEAGIAAGTFIPLLADWQADDTEEVHAVYVPHPHLSTGIRAFVDFLVKRIGRD